MWKTGYKPILSSWNSVLYSVRVSVWVGGWVSGELYSKHFSTGIIHLFISVYFTYEPCTFTVQTSVVIENMDAFKWYELWPSSHISTSVEAFLLQYNSMLQVHACVCMAMTVECGHANLWLSFSMRQRLRQLLKSIRFARPVWLFPISVVVMLFTFDIREYTT